MSKELQLQAQAGALQHLSGPAMEALPLGLRVMFDDHLYAQVERAAIKLAKAEGFAPPHLIGKTEACFAVVVMALSWKLNPWNVAQATYQTPGGKVGYEGKLCQAILEASGHLEGGVTYEHFGDWQKVAGRYEVRKGNTGKDYAARTWDRKDVGGLGVIVRATVKGESKPRELEFRLDDAFPLNSTLWATSPKRQICYTAVRAFANTVVPALFMGVPFDKEDDIDTDPAASARDVSPPAASGSRLDDLTAKLKPAEQTEHDADGVVQEQQEPRAVRAVDMPDDMKQALEDTIQDLEAAGAAYAGPADEGMVVLTFPGPARRAVTLSLDEARQQINQFAGRAQKKKGAKWCQAALELNPWLDDLAPELKAFLVQKGLECMQDEDKAEASTDLLES